MECSCQRNRLFDSESGESASLSQEASDWRGGSRGGSPCCSRCKASLRGCAAKPRAAQASVVTLCPAVPGRTREERGWHHPLHQRPPEKLQTRSRQKLMHWHGSRLSGELQGLLAGGSLGGMLRLAHGETVRQRRLWTVAALLFTSAVQESCCWRIRPSVDDESHQS